MGIKTDKSIQNSTNRAKENYNRIKNSGTASAREIRLAHNKMTAKIKANNRELAGGAGKLSKSFSALKGSFVGIAVAIAGVGIAVKKAFDAAELGAKLQVQREAFDNYAASMGANGDEIIAKLKEVSKGTVATSDLVASAGRAMLLGLDPSKLVGLLKIARAASKLTGDTVTKSFEDITLGIGRQSKMILDNLGILLDVGKANDDYAASIDKTTAELTDNEKKLAVLHATVEAGGVIIRRSGKDYDSTLDKIQRMKVAWKEAREGAAAFATDAFVALEPAINAIGMGLKWVGDISLSTINMVGAVFTGLSIAVNNFAGKIAWLTDKLGITKGLQDDLADTSDKLKKRLDAFADRITKAGREAEKAARKNKKLAASHREIAKAVTETSDADKKAKDKALENIEIEIRALKSGLELRKKLTKLAKEEVRATEKQLDALLDKIDRSKNLLKSIDDILADVERAKKIQGLTDVEVDIFDLEAAAKNFREKIQGATVEQQEELIKAAVQAAANVSTLISKSADGGRSETAGVTGQRTVSGGGGVDQGLEEAKILAEELTQEARDFTLEMIKADEKALPGVIDSLEKQREKVEESKLLYEQMLIDVDELNTKAQELKDKMNEDTKSKHTRTLVEVQAKSQGGLAQPVKAQTGRHLPGYGGGDKIPALLEAGEYVIRKEAVRRMGYNFIDAINRMDVDALMSQLTAPTKEYREKFREGGIVGAGVSTAQEPVVKEIIQVDLTQGGKSLKLHAGKTESDEFFKDMKRMNIIHGRRKRAY